MGDNFRDTGKHAWTSRADVGARSPQFSTQQFSPERKAWNPHNMEETPREMARRRKCEAADRDAARLCTAHVEVACASRQMGQRLREAQARSFVAPFATTQDVHQRHADSNACGNAYQARMGNAAAEGCAAYPSQSSHAFASPRGPSRDTAGYAHLTPCKDM